MTLGKLIKSLQEIAEKIGDHHTVVILDGEGEWPFCIHVQREMLEPGRSLVVCLDVTGEPDEYELPEV